MTTNTDTTAASGAASPLTDDQIKAIHHGLCTTTGANYLSMARAIEAAHGITAGAPAAQEAEPVGYWVSFTDEPELELGHWFSEEPCGEGYLSLPLYTHPPRPQADAGAPPAVPEWCRSFAERQAYQCGVADARAQAPAAGAAPTQHITQPYTVAEIRERVASGDYSAELMLQHALLHLGAGAAPTDAEIDALWREATKDHGETTVEFTRWFARAVLARWGAAAPAQEADASAWATIPTHWRPLPEPPAARARQEGQA